MKANGIERFYQFEGGILEYFEGVDGAHDHGDCFVFDEREAVSANLQPAAGRVHRQSTCLYFTSDQPGVKRIDSE